MARVPIENNFFKEGIYNTPANRYDAGSGSSSSSSHSRDSQLNNTIAEQVMNSPAYKSAYNVLSQESDKSWLQRLEMIPYSVSDASSTFFDSLGLSNNFNDKQDANYQYCMEQISALMAEYQSWKNSLPATQTQQMADAGINSAITGQGINGSSVPNVGIGSDPSQLKSTNQLDLISSLGALVSNTSNGLLSWCSLFKEVSQFGQKLDFDKESFNKRLSFDETSFSKSYDLSFKQWAHNKGIDFAKLNTELVGLGLSPINDEMSVYDVSDMLADSSYHSNAMLSNLIKDLQLDNHYQLQYNLSKSINDNVVELAKLQYAVYKSDLELRRLINKRSKAENDYQLGYFGDDPNAFGDHMRNVDLEIQDCIAQRSDLESNYVESLVNKANNGDSPSAYMLIQYLTGVGFSDYTRMLRGAKGSYFDDKYLPIIADVVKSMMSSIK